MNVLGCLGNIFMRLVFNHQFIFVLLSCLIAQSHVSDAGDIAENPFAKFSEGEMLSISVKDAILQALERNPTVSIQRLASEVARTYASEQREAFDKINYGI